MKDKDKQILEHMIRYCEEIRLAQERFGKDRETFYNEEEDVPHLYRWGWRIS